MTTNNDIKYKIIKPEPSLINFVESFWMLHNQSNSNKEVIILPDGKIDLFFSQSAIEPFHITLIGIETQPKQAISVQPQELIFAISFKLLATEYIFRDTISNILDEALFLPDNFWDFGADDLKDFDQFCKKATLKIQSLSTNEIDNRKQQLFDLIYSSNGALSVKEVAEKVFWSCRQINRYFNKQYGLSLKVYCKILRFRASFKHIKEGKLFPHENFADQSHFIKEIKKLSGVLPKELARNQNDRFIQFSTLLKK
jgi:AraC-like DNA-binding protein